MAVYHAPFDELCSIDARTVYAETVTFVYLTLYVVVFCTCFVFQTTTDIYDIEKDY